MRSAYIIATTPRSGSSLLGAALLQTGIAGKPQEYFHLPLREEFLYRRKFGAKSEKEYVRAVIEGSSTENGVFGVKIHAMQTPNFVAKVESALGTSIGSLHTAVESVMPNARYIFVRRKDTLAQAASFYRALVTDEWWRFPGAGAPNRDAQIQFDCSAISHCQMLIEASDAYWENYFSLHGLQPLRITYEDFVSDYENTVRATLGFLGLPIDTTIPPQATVKIGDRRSQMWIDECRKLEKLYTAEDVERCRKRWAQF